MLTDWLRQSVLWSTVEAWDLRFDGRLLDLCAGGCPAEVGVYMIAARAPYERDARSFELLYVGASKALWRRLETLAAGLMSPSNGRQHPMSFKAKSYPGWLPTYDVKMLHAVVWNAPAWKHWEWVLQKAIEEKFGAPALYNGFDRRSTMNRRLLIDMKHYLGAGAYRVPTLTGRSRSRQQKAAPLR